MISSSNGNIFRVTGHLGGEFTGPRWISRVWIDGWVNNREAGDLRRYMAHYDVIVMPHGLAGPKSHHPYITITLQAEVFRWTRLVFIATLPSTKQITSARLSCTPVIEFSLDTVGLSQNVNMNLSSKPDQCNRFGDLRKFFDYLCCFYCNGNLTVLRAS